MKKVLLTVSIFMLANPLHATPKKIKMHHHKGKHLYYKDVTVKATDTKATETGAPAATTTPSWLDNVSGSMAMTTNYMFRGISLSQDNPAVQGGLTYTFPVGLYFNVWGSNANYSAPDGKTVTSEIDTIAGYQGSVGDNFSYNINLDRYNYPGARKANYNELNTLWTYRIFTLGVSYTSNYSGYHASGTYVNGTLNFNIPPCYALNVQDVSILAEMGHYSLARAAGYSYNDYSLTINKVISDKYTVSLAGTGTNGRAKTPPYDGNQIVGTVTAVF